jgi:hypothetical protein
VEKQKDAVTSSAQFRKTEFFVFFRQIILQAYCNFTGKKPNQPITKKNVSLVINQFITSDFKIEKDLLETFISNARNAHPDWQDLQACYIVGAACGYVHPLVLDAPWGLDRLQSDAFIEGVVVGEKAWHEANPDEDN